MKSNNGDEYKNKKIAAYLQERGISIENLATHTHNTTEREGRKGESNDISKHQNDDPWERTSEDVVG